ncbi:MAG TPA: ABC transporter substrate-binding protein [Bryobacteraceae bacterium]|nr:ABC transporter substrate-binding protein [Bryobacteraceae bacterium]
MNRRTHELEPNLATSWRISENGRRIDFQLRSGVLFSDGTPFSCQDVAYTIRQMMDPALHSAVGDSFRTAPGPVEAGCTGAESVMARFPAPVAAIDLQFDQLAILSSRSPRKEAAVLGPFMVSEYKPANYILLKRNPNYWMKDERGIRLPYLDAIRLEIQQNRETEALRFERGQLDLVNSLAPDLFEQLASRAPKSVVDAGPSFDWELVFFNQVAKAPIAEYKKRWFRSANFRRAISEAIHRDDLCKVVYRGHAVPAAGPVSPSNKLWLNTSLKPETYSVENALARLAKDGFQRKGSGLVDSSGNAVEFSMITNAGSKVHERMMTMIQQDLAKLGVRLNVVALDFPSLVERISQSFAYETCLMAFANIDLDPGGQVNVWMSSAENHQWNPNQKQPETEWEAEIDRLMRTQAATSDIRKRKIAFDRVQEIVAEQAPMLFLVYPNALSAISMNVRNSNPAVLRPQTYWNAERLFLGNNQKVASR